MSLKADKQGGPARAPEPLCDFMVPLALNVIYTKYVNRQAILQKIIMSKIKEFVERQINDANISVALIAIALMLPKTSYAAGVDVILLLPASWLLSLMLAILSIAISNKKLIIFNIHLASAVFYILSRRFGLEGVESTIGFFYLVMYPILSSSFILILSFRWRYLAKTESSDR
ncbi:MAG: hypothetical protein PVG75_10800 [Thioalkalispiraceae bacterium]|jgi:hypothetical protein